MSFSILIIIFLVMVFISYSEMQNMNVLAEEEIHLSYMSSSLQEFAVSLESLERNIDNFFILNYQENRNDVNKDLEKMNSIVTSLKNNADSEELGILVEMESNLSELHAKFNNLANSDLNKMNTAVINEKGILIYQLIIQERQMNRELLLMTNNKTQVNVKDHHLLISNMVSKFSIMSILVLILGILLSVHTYRSISYPIKKLMEATSEIGRGRFNVDIPIRSNDEVGQLGLAFNKMTGELQRTTVSKDYVENIIQSMFDALIVTSKDLTMQTVNKAICDMLGYRSEELLGRPVKMLFSNNASDIGCKCHERLGKECLTINIEKACYAKDGREIPVLLSISTMCDGKGNILGIVFVAKDITERKRAEEKIKKSLEEKETLLKEIHHRVKNNLQIVSSLLDHQTQFIKDQNVINIFAESQNRIISMSLVHEKLYQSKDLSRINFDTYVYDLVAGLFQSYDVNHGKVALNLIIEDIQLDIDSAIPCGLIINELATNTLKYAFPADRKGEFRILFHRIDGDMLELIVGDNGIGLPEGLDFRKASSLGLHLVTILAENQLHGEIKQNRNNGTEFQIKFRGIKR